MNGMKAKAQRLKQAKRFSREGLPIDAKEWTEADWRDLHEAMQKAIERIRERHKQEASP